MQISYKPLWHTLLERDVYKRHNQYMFYDKKASDPAGKWKAQFISSESFKWQCYYAVSYTHLDVYKRQEEQLHQNRPQTRHKKEDISR